MDQILFPGHDVLRHNKDSQGVGYSFLIHYPVHLWHCDGTGDDSLTGGSQIAISLPYNPFKTLFKGAVKLGNVLPLSSFRTFQSRREISWTLSASLLFCLA